MKNQNLHNIETDERAFFRYLTLFFLSFFALCVAMGWLNQLAPVSFWSRRLALPIALIGAVALTMVLCRTQKRILTPVVGMLLFALLMYVSSRYLDFSWDGLAYHQRAVIALLKGANFLSVAEPTGDIWVDNYAKATWFYGATLVSWFGRSEFGSSYHFILSSAAASYLYLFCRWLGRGRVLSTALALIAFFNPVTIAQWFTYYNDAAIGALGLLLFLSAVMLAHENRLSDQVVFLVSAILVVNVKASGVILAGTAFLYLGIATLAQSRNLLISAKKVGVQFAVFLVLGMGGLGYSPYVQNMVHERHVFYPLAGERVVDIITPNAPYGFPQQNRFYNLFLSLFSKSADMVAADIEKKPSLKVPGIIYEGEIDEFWKADVRIGGFGPLYSLAFVLSLLAGMVLRIDWKIAGPLFFMIGLAIIINPYSWWARYNPTIWILPLIPIITMRGARIGIGLAVPLLVVVVMAINAGLLVRKWVELYPLVNHQVRAAAQVLHGKKLKIYQGPFASDLLIERLGLTGEVVDGGYYKNNKENFILLTTGIEYERE